MSKKFAFSGWFRVLLSSAVVILFSTTSCAQPEQAATVRLEGADLLVSGKMDASMLTQLRRQHWEKIHAVRFSSEGGEPENAVDIAELIARTGKPIIIHDICGSACIDVLIIRSGVSIEPDTLVLMHNNPVGQALTLQAYPAISGYVARLGDRERDWFLKNGVDPRLSLFSEAAMIPVCVFAPKDDPAMAPRIFSATRYLLWAPRSSTLYSLGVQAAQNWHQDTDSVMRIMRAKYPKADLARLRPADEPFIIPTTKKLESYLSRVGVCKTTAPTK